MSGFEWLPLGYTVKDEVVLCVSLNLDPHILLTGDRYIYVYARDKGAIFVLCLTCLGHLSGLDMLVDALPQLPLQIESADTVGKACGDKTAEEIARLLLSDGGNLCQHCGKKDARGKCGGCNLARYCSKDCQIKGWPSHFLYCRKKDLWANFNEFKPQAAPQ